MFKIFVAAFILTLVGCQTEQQKNIALIQDRAEKLKPLATWHSEWCRLETHLTEPAIARYREMFPDETEKLNENNFPYTWKARKYNCEINSLQPTPLTKNHKGFLESALCMLLQVHWVNSPFNDLVLLPQDIVSDEGRVHVRASPIDKALGIYLDPVAFTIETRTRSRGILRATYSQNGPQWLPARLEQVTSTARLVVDGIEYDVPKSDGRRLIKSLWISVGDEQSLRHTQVFFENCQDF